MCMRKLKFLNVTYNLLTKFLMEKNQARLLFNFLPWYEVPTYTGDTVWQIKLISDVINLIIWLCLKMVSGL